MLNLGGVGRGVFVYAFWHKSHVNMALTCFESTAWDFLSQMTAPIGQRPPSLSPPPFWFYQGQSLTSV